MEATLVMKELEPCAEGAQAAHGGTRERMGEACLALAGTLSAALGLAPVTAHAAVDVSGTLSNVLNMLANGIILLGGILVVMGLVNLGLSLKDGTQGGGGQLSGALAMIVGGMVIAGAGAYFRTFDTNLAG
ncbi:MAG: hypothetical protein IKG69_12180 [Atopobiaceae bacterium]|nr:hypothetical protein [Atopobiaceae bacterium]